MSKAEFAIIGSGEVACGIYPHRSEFEIAYRVAKLAIEDAGIDKNEVGAVLNAAHIMGSEFNTEAFFGRLRRQSGPKAARL